jgi:NADH:ubiquinone oxidoreductase subunit D
MSGPLRGSGVDFDIRKVEPYQYTLIDFKHAFRVTAMQDIW